MNEEVNEKKSIIENLDYGGSEEMWEEVILEKADIAANAAQKLLVVLVGINYWNVLPERSQCSQSLFSEWHNFVACIVVPSNYDFCDTAGVGKMSPLSGSHSWKTGLPTK